MGEIESAFLIVKVFENLYYNFYKPAPPEMRIYSIPREGAGPDDYPKKYRGMDREALDAWIEELRGLPGCEDGPYEPLAQNAMLDLEEEEKADDDFIFSIDDAQSVFDLLQHPLNWELVWACRNESGSPRQPAGDRLGFDVTWFSGDHFSAIADSMFFPRWHGTDEESGTLFLPFHERLNTNGLFESAAEARDFSVFYESHDWTESGPFHVAEIRLMPRLG
ncbi:MAG: hypothetical protein O7D91_03285 [Planctomycetota bacterium]|nr:hypothetical protein [Planctomycetota bacterium]